MRPALDPIIENQPVIAVEDDNDSGNDTLTAKNTVKENKAKEEVGNINKNNNNQPNLTRVNTFSIH